MRTEWPPGPRLTRSRQLVKHAATALSEVRYCLDQLQADPALGSAPPPRFAMPMGAATALEARLRAQLVQVEQMLGLRASGGQPVEPPAVLSQMDDRTARLDLWGQRRAGVRSQMRCALWRWVFWFTQDRWRDRMCALVWSTKSQDASELQRHVSEILDWMAQAERGEAAAIGSVHELEAERESLLGSAIVMARDEHSAHSTETAALELQHDAIVKLEAELEQAREEVGRIWPELVASRERLASAEAGRQAAEAEAAESRGELGLREAALDGLRKDLDRLRSSGGAGHGALSDVLLAAETENCRLLERQLESAELELDKCREESSEQIELLQLELNQMAATANTDRSEARTQRQSDAVSRLLKEMVHEGRARAKAGLAEWRLKAELSGPRARPRDRLGGLTEEHHTLLSAVASHGARAVERLSQETANALAQVNTLEGAEASERLQAVEERFAGLAGCCGQLELWSGRVPDWAEQGPAERLELVEEGLAGLEGLTDQLWRWAWPTYDGRLAHMAQKRAAEKAELELSASLQELELKQQMNAREQDAASATELQEHLQAVTVQLSARGAAGLLAGWENTQRQLEICLSIWRQNLYMDILTVPECPHCVRAERRADMFRVKWLRDRERLDELSVRPPAVEDGCTCASCGEVPGRADTLALLLAEGDRVELELRDELDAAKDEYARQEEERAQLMAGCQRALEELDSDEFVQSLQFQLEKSREALDRSVLAAESCKQAADRMRDLRDAAEMREHLSWKDQVWLRAQLDAARQAEVGPVGGSDDSQMWMAEELARLREEADKLSHKVEELRLDRSRLEERALVVATLHRSEIEALEAKLEALGPGPEDLEASHDAMSAKCAGLEVKEVQLRGWLSAAEDRLARAMLESEYHHEESQAQREQADGLRSAVELEGDKQVAELSKELRRVSDSAGEMRRRLTEATARVEFMAGLKDEAEARSEQMARELDDQRSHVDELKQHIKQAQEALTEDQKNKHLVAELQEKDLNLDKLRRERLELRQSKVKKAMLLEEAESKLEALTREKIAQNEDVAALEQKVERLQSVVMSMDNPESTTKILNEQVEDQSAELAEMTKKLRKAKEQKKTAYDVRDKLKEEIQRKTTEIYEVRQYLTQVQQELHDFQVRQANEDYEGQVSQLVLQVSEMGQSMRVLHEKCAEYETRSDRMRVSRDRSEKRLNKTHSEIKMYVDRCTELQADLGKLREQLALSPDEQVTQLQQQLEATEARASREQAENAKQVKDTEKRAALMQQARDMAEVELNQQLAATEKVEAAAEEYRQDIDRLKEMLAGGDPGAWKIHEDMETAIQLKLAAVEESSRLRETRTVAEERVHQLEEQLEALEGKYQALGKDLRPEIQTLQKRCELADAEAKRLEAELAEADSRLEPLSDKVDAVEEDRAELREQVAALRMQLRAQVLGRALRVLPERERLKQSVSSDLLSTLMLEDERQWRIEAEESQSGLAAEREAAHKAALEQMAKVVKEQSEQMAAKDAELTALHEASSAAHAQIAKAAEVAPVRGDTGGNAVGTPAAGPAGGQAGARPPETASAREWQLERRLEEAYSRIALLEAKIQSQQRQVVSMQFAGVDRLSRRR